MTKPATTAAPATKDDALKAFLAASRANIRSLKDEAERLSDAAATIIQSATAPLTQDQIEQIHALHASENLLNEKIVLYSVIENMRLNSAAAVRGLKEQIAATNKQITDELKSLDGIVKTINSVKAVIDGLTALLNAAAAVTKLFA
jgi:hypothetical protein